MGLNRAMLGAVIQHKNLKSTDYSPIPDDTNQAFSQEFAYGTGANQADLVFGLDRRTLAGGADESLDLIGGGLVDNLNNALAFVKVRALFIKNLSTTKVLTIGNDANPLIFLGGAAYTAELQPGGMLALTNPITGWTVTPGTGDKIKIANNAGDPADYAVWIAGTSA